MSTQIGSVRVETTSEGEASITLEGTYTLFEVEQALRELRAPLQQLKLDWTRGQVDHSAFELERLANLLSVITQTLIVRTADALHYGFARTLMGYCSSKGVTVHVHHQDL